MKSNQDILSSILKTTQMGQTGIRAVLDHAVRADLRSALQSQLREYDAIEAEAYRLAASRGWELKELDPAAKAMSRMWSRMNLSCGHADSKIAAMMIQGNTRGMIKGLKNCHHAQNPDNGVLSLAKKLHDTEEANIHQMQGYV